MRKLFIAGNWKMNTDAKSASVLALGLAKALDTSIYKAVDVAVCPPFVYLQGVATALAGSKISLGAQNVYFEDNGAFTGETSCAMLKDLCCEYVILGHSERRHVIGETDGLINKKMHKTLASGLKPIFAVGELLAQREANETDKVVKTQIEKGLAGITAEQMKDITIAYEPVWAIGTGKTATSGQAQAVHAFIRQRVASLDGQVAAKLCILYGGSVKANNATELFAMADIDGGLIGGASLVADEFLAICRAGQV